MSDHLERQLNTLLTQQRMCRSIDVCILIIFHAICELLTR